jgi:hypothetical protein
MENVPHPVNDPRLKPREVKIAHTLWICTGVLLLLMWAAACTNNTATTLTEDSLTMDIIATYFLVLAIAVFVFAVRFGRGAGGSRTALFVVGGLAMLGCWTVPLIVIAFVLQSRPAAEAWFVAMKPPPA